MRLKIDLNWDWLLLFTAIINVNLLKCPFENTKETFLPFLKVLIVNQSALNLDQSVHTKKLQFVFFGGRLAMRKIYKCSFDTPRRQKERHFILIRQLYELRHDNKVFTGVFEQRRPWARGYKTFFMLNSAEHETCPANNSQITSICKFFLAKHSWGWKFFC